MTLALRIGSPNPESPGSSRATNAGFRSLTHEVADEKELRKRFLSLRQWQVGGRRAPHKPLLALWAIGRCLDGCERLAEFDTVRSDLTNLLKAFGPPSKVFHPEHPFWRMRNDNVWEIPREGLVKTTSQNDALVSSLRKQGIEAGFPVEIHQAFRQKPELAVSIALDLIDAHFPESLRNDILEAVGIEPGRYADNAPDQSKPYFRAKRNPRFRGNVLDAYGHKCAVCEFSVRFPEKTLALEAAHIRWHVAGGPDKVSNGLSLCVMHHKLFDLGAFTLGADLRVQVARSASGGGHRLWLGDFHGKPLRVKTARSEQPDPSYLDWHRKEVFRRPGALLET